MVDYNGVIYTYAQNYQGDILGLLDNTGAAVVTYSYDAWGRLLATGGSMAATLGKLNPFRYRGYVYDEETGLYYLRSRYYNPEWGRFISSDALLGKVGAVGTHNLFAYCENEPVMRADYSGRAYTYDAVNAYDRPPTTMELVEDFFARISKTDASAFDYADLGNGSFTYTTTTKIVAYSNAKEVFDQLLSLGNTAIMGYLSTKLISNPTIGAIVAVAQYSITEVLAWSKAISIPSIPEGVYTHEVVEYKEDVPGFFGHTSVYSYHYLHGYDTSGCTYYAIWTEIYTHTLFGSEHHSYVLSQRTQS